MLRQPIVPAQHCGVIEDGEISVRAPRPIGCVATASDGDRILAMLVPRNDETLAQLLTRLGLAITKACIEDVSADEIGTPPMCSKR